jgi:hypothetical protein
MIQLKTQFLVQSRVDGLQHKFHYKFGDDKIYMVHMKKLTMSPLVVTRQKPKDPGTDVNFIS